jgi:hypothetical protein
MLISTFELLLKPQLPPGIPGVVSNLSRNVIQGYFLTIANLSSFDLALSLVFTTRLTPPTTLTDFIDFVDTSGTNISGPLDPIPFGNKFRYSPLFLRVSASQMLLTTRLHLRALVMPSLTR